MKTLTLIIGMFLLLPTSLLAAEGGQGQTVAPDTPRFISLSTHVVVDAKVVRLSDIFQGVVEHGDSVVAYAPRLGGRSTFDSRWLHRVALAYKLNWRPSSNMDRVVIERASRLIRREEVESILHTYMVGEGVDPSSQAVLSNRAMRLYLPANSDQSLAIDQMSLDQSSGRFTAMMSWGTAADERMRISGRVQRMTEVPVLTNRIMRGDLISKSDIEWITIPESRLSRTTLIDIDQIVGMAAKRAIQPGKSIAQNDLRRPLLVNRGETVTMVLNTPSMQLSAKGRALQSGSNGDTIRISNLQTSTVIDAVVTGSGQVRVDMSVNLAMR